MRQPPPGATITPTPFAWPSAGRNTVIVGCETLRSMAICEPSSAGCRYETSTRSGPLVGGPSDHRRITSLACVRVITSARASSAMAGSPPDLAATLAQSRARGKGWGDSRPSRQVVQNQILAAEGAAHLTTDLGREGL